MLQHRLVPVFLITFLSAVFVILAGATDVARADAKDPAPKAKLDVKHVTEQCNQGHLGMCIRLGSYYERLGKIEDAANAYAPACQGNDEEICLKLADFAANKQDPKKAMRWLRTACRSPKSKGEGCFRIALMAVQNKSEKNARTWFRKACDQGHAAACAKLSK